MTTATVGYDESKVDESKVEIKRAKPITARLGWITRLAPPVSAAVISTVAMIGAFRLWRMHLGVPLLYGADSLAAGMNVKQVVVNGWYFTDPHLAAPFVQHFQDWPLPDVLSLSISWLLGLFTNNWAAVVNGMFMLSFPLTAVTGWWAFTKLGVSKWVSVALGVVYSLLPYHRVRGESHLFLSNYFVVPLGMYLAVKVMSGEDLFSSSRRYKSRYLRFASARTLQTLALAVVIGLDGVYYAAFTLMFVAAALVVRLLVTRRWRDVGPGFGVLAVIFVAVLACTAPTIAYHLSHNSNPQAGLRAPSDTEYYGLKVSHMLLPADGHRIASFNNVQNRYYSQFPIPSERGSAALGIIGGFGLMWLLVIAVVRCVRRSSDSVLANRSGQLAALNLIAIVVGTVGGLSTMIALFISAEIRSWNRISIFIGAFALCAVGLLVDRGLRLAKSAPLCTAATAVAFVLLIGIGFFDQTNNAWVPAYAATSQSFLSDQSYFHSIQNVMPAGSDIFELPIQTFPEAAPINGLGSYDLLKPYLNTSTLHWSFAGVKGRLESTWQSRLPDLTAATAPAFLADVVASGFTGVYIDRSAYSDNAAAIQAALETQLKVAPMVNADNSKLFYDIRAYAKQLQQTEPAVLATDKADMLFPVYIENVTKPYGIESDATGSWYWANGSSTGFPIFDGATKAQPTKFSFAVQSATAGVSHFVITWPDGTKQTVVAGDSPVQVTRDVNVPTNRSQLQISSSDAQRLPSGIDPRNLHFRVENLRVENLRVENANLESVS